MAGWLAVREFLALRPDEQGGTSPGLRIFDTCINLIRTLPAVQHDEKKPEDVANAVAFFAAEQSSYLTGQVLCVDGGMAM